MIEKIKALFYKNTLKRWHFEDICTQAGISRERVNFSLKKLLKEELILKIKPHKKMPYYIANSQNPKFRVEKRLYGLTLLANTGLFEHIQTLNQVKSAILFGSFSRGDWNMSSDIDLFIYGDAEHFEKGYFESILKREIQIFHYDNSKKMLKELDQKLIPNILKGFNIKGSLEPFVVSINA